ncbi:hypothetical protein ABW20_dc0106191 [Dactylellina cionopaga]|nr:hypothetical protein ABW20_dc0106191 [Dactylellina cionopaga]
MFGFDSIRRFAVRSLALLPRGQITADPNSDYSPKYLEDNDILLSVGTYGGDISILKYNPYREDLTVVSTYHESDFQPSWQTVHPQDKDMIYSTDEGNPGGILSFRLDRDSGKLTKVARSDGINGTVSIAIHNDLLITAA